LSYFTSSGPGILWTLKPAKSAGFEVNIPQHYWSWKVCRPATCHGVDLLTHPAATSVERALCGWYCFIAAQGSYPPPNTVITLLTSQSFNQAANLDLKIPLSCHRVCPTNGAARAKTGLDELVCSPQEVETRARWRDVWGHPSVLVCPGIRPSWATAGDQRDLTPVQALKVGGQITPSSAPHYCCLQTQSQLGERNL